MSKLIVCAGMHRSGSTWLYNVVRYCYLNAGYRTYSDAAHQYKASILADVHVVKIHRFDQKLYEKAERIFTTVRDLRDVVASMIRFKLTRDTKRDVARCTAKLISRDYLPWAVYSDMEVRYEEMIRDRPGTITAILRILDLPDVDPVEVQRDVEKLTKMALPDVDRTTQFLPHHLTDGRIGSYGETLSPMLLEVVLDVGGDWLVKHGYTV